MMKIAFLYLSILSLILAQIEYPTVVFDTTQPLEASTNTFYVSENGDFNINGTTPYSYRIPLVANNLYMLFWGTSLDDFLFVIKSNINSPWNNIFAAAANFDSESPYRNVLFFEVQNSGFYNLTITYIIPDMMGGQSFCGWGVFDVLPIFIGEDYIERIPNQCNKVLAGYLEIETEDLQTVYDSISSDKYIFKFNSLNASEEYHFHPCNHAIDFPINSKEFQFNETGRYIIYEDSYFGKIFTKTTTPPTQKIAGFHCFGIGMMIGLVLVILQTVRKNYRN